MNINSRYGVSIVALVISWYISCTEPTITAIEEGLTGDIAHISNLTINIECSPQQIIKDIRQDQFLMFDKIPEIPVEKYASMVGSAIYDLKFQVGGCAAIGLYVFLLYHVLKGNSYLNSATLWSQWKQESPFEEFIAIPTAVLSHDLILEIQRRYTSAAAPADFVSSLVAFMKDIDQEIASVKYYNNLVSWLTRLRISLLFPIKHKLFAKAQEHLNRLCYIRNLFLSWAAQYKMDKNKRYVIGS